MQPPDEATDFLVGGRSGTLFQQSSGIQFQIAAGVKSVEQKRGEALEIGRSCGEVSLRLRSGPGIANEFVKADGYRLPQVHGAVLFTRGDTHEPVTVAEVLIRKATLLRTEKKSDAVPGKTFAEEARGLIEPTDRVLQLAQSSGGGSHNETAIFDRFSNGLKLFGFGEQRRGADGGTRLAKCELVGVHHAKMEETEVAHGAGGSADVEGIARGDKHDPQEVGFGVG